MKNSLTIGLLLFVLLFFTPMWAISKLDRIKTDEVIDNHAHSLLFMTREHKEMQIDIARLIYNNHKLEDRLEKCEAAIESFKELIKAAIESFKELIKVKFPNFIKEGQENGSTRDVKIK